MGKGVSLMTAGNRLALANGGMKFSKRMLIEQIELHKEFQKLFVMEEDLLERITESIKANGFDNSQPVHIWKTKDGHLYLIDGYTRYTASCRAGLSSIPVFEHDFENFEEAFRYAISLQKDRRNIEPGELMNQVTRLMKTKFVKNHEGDKATLVAETLGVSRSSVTRAIAVDKKADKETRKKLSEGQMSLSDAYSKVQGKDTPKEKHAIEKDVSESELLPENSCELEIVQFVLDRAGEGMTALEITRLPEFIKILKRM